MAAKGSPVVRRGGGGDHGGRGQEVAAAMGGREEGVRPRGRASGAARVGGGSPPLFPTKAGPQRPSHKGPEAQSPNTLGKILNFDHNYFSKLCCKCT